MPWDYFIVPDSQKYLFNAERIKLVVWVVLAIAHTGSLLFQIVFEAIRGNGYRGDIAIDDIAFTVGTCAILPHNAKPAPPPTIPPTTGPPTVPPKGKFDCNFEVDFCLWTQDSTDSFNWTRQQGRTSSTNTGPTTDHTLKSGVLSDFLHFSDPE